MAGIDVSITYKANAGQATKAGDNLLKQLDAILKQINAIGTTTISSKPFDALSVAMKESAKETRDFNTAVKALNTNLRTLMDVADKAATKLPAAFAGIGTAGAAIAAMLPPLQNLLREIIGPLSQGMSVLAQATKASANAMKILNKEAERGKGDNGGILKRVLGSENDLTRFAVFINKTFASVAAATQGVGASIRQGLGSAASALRAFGTAGASYLRTFSNSLTSIIGTGGFLQKLGSGAGQLIGGFVKFGATAAGSFIAGFGKTLAALPRILGDAIKLLGSSVPLLVTPLTRAGALIGGLILGGVTNAIGGLFKAVSSVLTGVADLVGGVVESFGKIVGEAITAVFSVAGAIADRVFSTLTELGGFAAEVFSKAFGAALLIGLPLIYRSAKLREELVNTFAVVSDEITQEVFQQLVTKAKQVNVDFGVPLSQLPSGLFKTVSQGFGSVEESIGKYTAAVKLAAVGNTELNSAVETINLALLVFGKQVRTAEQVATAFFNATRKGRIEIDDFTQNFGRVAGLAEQNGVAFNDLLTALNLVSRTLPASSAFIGLSNAIEALNTPSKEAADLLGRLNISFTEIDGSLKSFPRIIQTIKDAGITTQQLRSLVPEVRGRRALAALIAQVEEYDEVMKLVTDGPSEFNKALEFSAQQISRAFKSLVASAESLADTFTEKLRGPLVRVFDFITSQVKRLDAAVGALNTGVFDQLADNVISFLSNLPAKVERGFALISSGVTGTISLLKRFKEALDDNFNLSAAIDLFSSGRFGDAFDAVFGSKGIEKVKTFFDQMVISAKVALGAILQLGSAVIQTIVGGVSSITGGIGSVGSAIPGISTLAGGRDLLGTGVNVAYGASGPLAGGRRVAGAISGAGNAAPVGFGAGALVGGTIGGLTGGPPGILAGAWLGAKIGAVLTSIAGALGGVEEANREIAKSQADASEATARLREAYDRTTAVLQETLRAAFDLPAAGGTAVEAAVGGTRQRLIGLQQRAAALSGRRTDISDRLNLAAGSPTASGYLDIFRRAGGPGALIGAEAQGRQPAQALSDASREFYDLSQDGFSSEERISFLRKYRGLIEDMIKAQAEINAAIKDEVAEKDYAKARAEARTAIEERIALNLRALRDSVKDLEDKYRAEFQIRTVAGGKVNFRDEGATLAPGERTETSIRASGNQELLQALRELIGAIKDMSTIAIKSSDLERARYELEKKKLALDDPANAPELKGVNTHGRARIRRAVRERERAAGAALNARLNDDVGRIDSGLGGESIFGIGGGDGLRGLAFGGEAGFGRTPAAFAGIGGANPAKNAAIFERGLTALSGGGGLGIDPRSGRVADIEALLGGFGGGGDRIAGAESRLSSRSARLAADGEPDFGSIRDRIFSTADEVGLGDEIRKAFKDGIEAIRGGASPTSVFKGILTTAEDRVRGDTDALSSADSVSRKAAREKAAKAISDARDAVSAVEKGATPEKLDELIKKEVGGPPDKTSAAGEEAKIKGDAGIVDSLDKLFTADKESAEALKEIASKEQELITEMAEAEKKFAEDTKESAKALIDKFKEYNDSNREVQNIISSTFKTFTDTIDSTRKELDAFKESMKR